MTTSARAQWLLARRARWCGLSPREVVDGELSPRAVALVTEMRGAELFPDYWGETEVLFAFLGAVAEARIAHRRGYAAVVEASDLADLSEPGRPYARMVGSPGRRMRL